MGINGYKRLVKSPPKVQPSGPGGNGLNIPPREQPRSDIEVFAQSPTTAERLQGLKKPINYSSDPEGFIGSTTPSIVQTTEAAKPPTERFDELSEESNLITQGLTDLPPGADPASILERRNEVEHGREAAALEVLEDEVTRPNSGVGSTFDRTYLENLAENHKVDLVRAPIQYLLDDPAKLNALDQANDNDGGPDDNFSLGDIHRRRLELGDVPELAERPHADGGAYTLPTDDTTAVTGALAVPERGQSVFDRQQQSIEAALRTDDKISFELGSGETTQVSVDLLESDGAARYELTLADGSTIQLETELGLEDSIAGIANVIEWENSLGSQTDLDTTVETIRFNKDPDGNCGGRFREPGLWG